MSVTQLYIFIGQPVNNASYLEQNNCDDAVIKDILCSYLYSLYTVKKDMKIVLL